MFLESSRCEDNQNLTLVKVPLIQQRPACFYRGIVVLFGARLTLSVSEIFICGYGGAREINLQ